MRKKILSIVLLGCMFGFGYYLGERNNERKHNNDFIITNPDLITIAKTWKTIEDNFAYVLDKDKQSKMKDSAIQSMLSSIDPHSYWWNSASQNQLEEKIKGEYGGIGIRYLFDDKDKNVKIIAIKEKSPADRAGLKVNDVILRVNDISYEDPAFNDSFKGEVGTKVNLDIKRNDKDLKIEIVRKKVTNFSAYSKVETIDNDKWLNIRITEFQEKTVDDMVNEIRNHWYTNDKPNNGIILDLRGSPGGLVDVSAGVASLFLHENKKVTRIKERNNHDVVFDTIKYSTEAWTKWAKDVPLIIWVDDKTASAAEILASALKDNKRTLFVIGTSTYGKGTVQRTFPITPKEQATFTIGFYKTPNNHYLQWKGVVPDVLIKFPSDIENERNLQKEKSVEGSLMPPEKESGNKPRIEIGISNNELKTNIDDIYLDKTKQILKLNAF